MRRPERAFWRGRRVLVTGHTGFKGAWLALMLRELGAEVTGIALPPPLGPSLFALAAPLGAGAHRLLDIRDAEILAGAVRQARPSVVFHLAAQALVRRSYREPAETFSVNVGGTVNLLQALRDLDGLEAAVMVTSDKVYRNDGGGRRFVETDPLGGEDPYSASKAAMEIAVASWRVSFASGLPGLVAARAGNVVGGGDFAEDRLVPDIVRAIVAREPLVVRYPRATRPWQHVLDVLTGYLLYAEQAAGTGPLPPALNFGPAEADPTTVAQIIVAFGAALGEKPDWRPAALQGQLREAPALGLDPSLAMTTLDWRPRLNRAETIRSTADWYAAWRRGEDMGRLSRRAVAEALA